MEQEVLKYTTVIGLISNILSFLFIWLLFVLRIKKITNEVQLHKCSTKLVLLYILSIIVWRN